MSKKTNNTFLNILKHYKTIKSREEKFKINDDI